MTVKKIGIIVPTSPSDLKTLKENITEISNSMTRVDGEKEHQKQIIEALSEKFGIDKKYIRRMANDFHKDKFEEKDEEHSEYSNLYEAVLS